MKNKVILLVLAIAIIAIIAVILLFTNNKKTPSGLEESNVQKSEVIEMLTLPVDIMGAENIKTKADGTKENTSSKLAKEQNLNGIRISNTKLTYANGTSVIIADITNDTGADITELGSINIKVKNELGTTVRELSVEIMDLKAGETKKINASITSDIVNAAEIEFSR